MTDAQFYRCVVTGRDSTGHSAIESIRKVSVEELGIVDFWTTDRAPAPLVDDGRKDWGSPRLEPPPGGTTFRLFEIPPQDASLSLGEAEAAAAAAFAAAEASHCRLDTTRHPMMHTTRTIDYVVVLKGEVTLLLDEAEVPLRPFDAVVQRATNHYWLNRSEEPALLMGVLLDAE